MNFIEKKISSLSDEQLYECYKDIKSYEEKGEMGETLVRKIRKEIADELGITSWDISCRHVVIPAILMEIANRFYSRTETKE